MTTRGVVVWFTGLPASGKTTLAKHVRDRLASRTPCVLLDSDELRDLLDDHAYDAGDRDHFYKVLGNLAVMLARQGHIVLVAATAPRRAHRDRVRTEAPAFVEIYVRTPLEACEARDIKGLYARARAEAASTLPGVGVPYEPPFSPDVTADGGLDRDAAAAIDRLVSCRAIAHATA